MAQINNCSCGEPILRQSKQCVKCARLSRRAKENAKRIGQTSQPSASQREKLDEQFEFAHRHTE